MGTDIHIWVEHRQLDGTWVTSDVKVDDSRQYNLFAALDDIRNPDGRIPAMDPEVVRDMAPEAKKEFLLYWGSELGGFQPAMSALTLDQLLAYDWEKWKVLCGYALPEPGPDFLEETIPAMQSLAAKLSLPHSDVRIVFFFDY